MQGTTPFDSKLAGWLHLAHTINAGSGALTPESGSPFMAATFASSVVITAGFNNSSRTRLPSQKQQMTDVRLRSISPIGGHRHLGASITIARKND